jgi:hypothetical protein
MRAANATNNRNHDAAPGFCCLWSGSSRGQTRQPAKAQSCASAHAQTAQKISHVHDDARHRGDHAESLHHLPQRSLSNHEGACAEMGKPISFPVVIVITCNLSRHIDFNLYLYRIPSKSPQA